MPTLQRINLPTRTQPSRGQIIGQAVSGAAESLGRGVAGAGMQKARSEALAGKQAERAERQAARDLREDKDDFGRWEKWVIAQDDPARRAQALDVGRGQGYDTKFPERFERVANPQVKFGETSDDVLSMVQGDWDRYIEGKSIEAEAKKKGAYDVTTEIIKKRARNPEEARAFRKSLNHDINLQYGIKPSEDKTDWDDFFGVEPEPLSGGSPGGPQGGAFGIRDGQEAGADLGAGISRGGPPPGLAGGTPANLTAPPVVGPTRPRPGGVDLSSLTSGAVPTPVVGPPEPEPVAPAPGGPAGGAFGITGQDGIGAGIAPTVVDTEARAEAILMAAINSPAQKDISKELQAQRALGHSWTKILANVEKYLPVRFKQMTEESR